MGTQEIICRLCLKVCENFKALEENMKEFLDTFLPKINLAVVQQPVVCTSCAEMLKKCFDFKTMCFNAQSNRIPFVNNKNTIKLDYKDVLLHRNGNGIGVSQDQDICGFCMSPLKNCSAIFLDVEEGEVMLKKMIEKCLPELELSINKKSVICTTCYESLDIYFRFVTKCLTVEEKIKKHCETLEISSRGQIELSQILQLTINDVTTETDGISTGIIKVEEQLCEERKYAENQEIGKGFAIKSEQMSCDDSEDVKVEDEHETKYYMDMTALKHNDVDQFTPKNMLACKEESDSLGVIKIEEEEIEIKIEDADFDRFEGGIVSPQLEVATSLLRNWECLIPNLEGNLLESNIKNTLTKKHVSKISMHQCHCCSYQTNNKCNLTRHLVVHRNSTKVKIHKCDFCSHQTKYKTSLKTHLLMHRNPSEVILYNCASCTFQTKRKGCLKRHLLVHRNSSEVRMYKCDSCSFHTKRKWCLKKHLLVHRDPSEVTMYKCDSCSYQTNYKNNLKIHLIVHKDPSEVTIYKCDSCSYQTKYKSCLKIHLLVHKDPSEATIYKCDSCSYQTNYRNCIKIHLLGHKDPSEVKIYKCDSCSYRTKREDCLKNHSLVHNNPSKIKMHKCDSCSYRTKHKCYLIQHILRLHKDSSEITT